MVLLKAICAVGLWINRSHGSKGNRDPGKTYQGENSKTYRCTLSICQNSMRGNINNSQN